MSNRTCCLILGMARSHAEFRTVMAEVMNLAQLSRTRITLLWIDDLDHTLFPRACVRVDDERSTAKDALEHTLLHYPVIADSMWIDEQEAWEVFRWRLTEDHRAR